MIPAYNAASYVEEAVRSALEQTVLPVEIICVDDGSTDSTLEILQRIEREDPEVVAVLTGPNRGAPVARNRGLHIARGEYVQFLDADDLLLPTKLEHQAFVVTDAGRPDLVIGAYHCVPFVRGTFPAYEVQFEDPWLDFLGGRQAITPSSLWRRETLLAVGGWEEGRQASQDSELNFRLLRSGAHVVTDATPLTIVRRREGSIWRRNPLVSVRGWLDLRLAAIGYLQEQEAYTPERQAATEAAAMRKIREAYRYDPALARHYHERMISASFVPDEPRGRMYRVLYRLLGFRWTERFYPYWESFH